MKIIDAAKTKNMATDMILVAVRDLKNPEHTLEAALWFVGPDFGNWAVLAHFPELDPLDVFRHKLGKYHAIRLLNKIDRVVKKYEFESILGENSGYSRRDVLRLNRLVRDILEEKAGAVVKVKKTKTPRQYWRMKKEERNNATIY